MNAMKKWVVAGLIGLSSVAVSMGTTVIDNFTTAGTGVPGDDGIGYYTPVGTGGGNGIYSGAVRYFSGSNGDVPFSRGAGDVGQMTLTQVPGGDRVVLNSQPENETTDPGWFTESLLYWTMGSYDGTYPVTPPTYPTGTFDLSVPGKYLHVSGYGSYDSTATAEGSHIQMLLTLASGDINGGSPFYINPGWDSKFLLNVDATVESGPLGDFWIPMSYFTDDLGWTSDDLANVTGILLYNNVSSFENGKNNSLTYTVTGLEFTEQGVPEPETVWMMLAVLGSLAVTFRRQLMDLAGRFVKT